MCSKCNNQGRIFGEANLKGRSSTAEYCNCDTGVALKKYDDETENPQSWQRQRIKNGWF